MKCRLIIDSPAAIDPEYQPPLRSQFATHEEYHDAKVIYDVDHSPHGAVIPAGTEISDINAWTLCFFDESGYVIEIDTDKGTRTPKRIAPGVIRAEPLDDACRAMLTMHCRDVAKARKCTVDKVWADIAAGVAKSKAQQAEIEAARAANVDQSALADTAAKDSQ